MKTILSSRRHNYLARIGIFLIMVALIAGMVLGIVGCGGTSTQYTLSVSCTVGGNVTHPGIGTFPYPAGAVVLLEAVPAEGYGFTHWSGNVSTIADVYATETSITVNGDYTITANFYSILSAANTELEQVKTGALAYFVVYHVWPVTSANLTTYIPGTLKAIYYFDTSYGWILNATPTVGGWTGIEFVGGVAGPTGQHGWWVAS